MHHKLFWFWRIGPLHLIYLSLWLKWKWINYLDFMCLFMLLIHLINLCVFGGGIQKTPSVMGHLFLLWDRNTLFAVVTEIIGMSASMDPAVSPLIPLGVLGMPREPNSAPQSLHSKCSIHWANFSALYLILKSSLNLEWCPSPTCAKARKTFHLFQVWLKLNP